MVAVALAAGAVVARATAQSPPPAGPRGPDSFTLRSKAFADNTRIPDKHTVEGADLSPPLAWTNAPAGTKCFAIICEDLDTPRKPFVHWVIYGIPADLKELPEGIARERDLEDPFEARQGISSFSKDNTGWRGPATPKGDRPHRYRFTIYALKDTMPEVKSGLNAELLRRKMQDLILGEASLTGTYSRARKPGEVPPGEQAPERVPGSAPPPEAPKKTAPPGKPADTAPPKSRA